MVHGPSRDASFSLVSRKGRAGIVPGLGLAIAGPLVGALAGAGAGGAAGSLVGALIGAGIPKEHAEVYQDGVKEGGIVVGAYPRDDDDRELLAKEWDTYGARNIHY